VGVKDLICDFSEYDLFAACEETNAQKMTQPLRASACCYR
jgi:hypothetical protein